MKTEWTNSWLVFMHYDQKVDRSFQMNWMLLRSLRQGQCEEVYNVDNLFEGVDVGTLYEELILRKVTVNFFKINFLEPKEASK